MEDSCWSCCWRWWWWLGWCVLLSSVWGQPLFLSFLYLFQFSLSALSPALCFLLLLLYWHTKIYLWVKTPVGVLPGLLIQKTASRRLYLGWEHTSFVVIKHILKARLEGIKNVTGISPVSGCANVFGESEWKVGQLLSRFGEDIFISVSLLHLAGPLIRRDLQIAPAVIQSGSKF